MTAPPEKYVKVLLDRAEEAKDAAEAFYPAPRSYLDLKNADNHKRWQQRYFYDGLLASAESAEPSVLRRFRRDLHDFGLRLGLRRKVR